MNKYTYDYVQLSPCIFVNIKCNENILIIIEKKIKNSVKNLDYIVSILEQSYKINW